MNPRILLIVVVLLIAGAYGLGVYNMLSTKSELEKVNAAVTAKAAELQKSMNLVTDEIAKASAGTLSAMTQATRAYGIASTAAPKNMTGMDMREFSSFHPEIKSIYRSAFADTIMPAVGSAVNRVWTLMTPTQRARVKSMTQTAAGLVAVEMRKMANTIPANPSASDVRALDQQLDVMEARIKRYIKRGNTMPLPSPPRPRPPMVMPAPPRPRPPMVIAAPRKVTAAPVPW